MSTTHDEDHPLDIPTRREDVVLEELDGEALVYDPQCGTVHRFNDHVLLVWMACDGSQDTLTISDLLMSRHTVERDQAEQMVNRIVAELNSLGLLQPNSTVSSERFDPANLPKGLSDGTLPDSPPLSRRRLISGGVGMLVLAPPVISTFFATGSFAAASNPINPGYSATGPGGCANPGYSCNTVLDCCNTLQSSCQGGECCIQVNQSGCFIDTDCCSGLTCNAGTCQV